MTGFDTGWELDFWGEFRRNIAAESAEVLASIASYDDVLVSLVAEVAATYIQLRTLEERLRLARHNVHIQSRSEQIADVRFRNGAVTELDVTQATALLRNTEALIPDLETQIRQSQNALSVLLGMPPRALNEVLGGTAPIPAPPSEVAVGLTFGGPSVSWWRRVNELGLPKPSSIRPSRSWVRSVSRQSITPGCSTRKSFSSYSKTGWPLPEEPSR